MGGAFRYSRRLTPCGRGLMAPPGLTALGAKGSVRDRLTPPGRVEGSALGRYIVSLRWRGGRPFGRHFLCRLWRRKPDNRLMDKPLWGLRVQRVVLSSIPVGACACGAEGRMASIGLPALGAKGCAERLHRFARGAADWRSGPRWSILSVLCPVHPFPLRGTSPQGKTRDMERKTGRHIHQAPFRRFPPLVAAPPPSRPVGKRVT